MEKQNDLKETPFVVTDLIDPEDPEPEDEIYNNNIPIRTWSRGKTLNEALFDGENESSFADDFFSFEGNLLGYFPELGQNDEEEVDDESIVVAEDEGAFDEEFDEEIMEELMRVEDENIDNIDEEIDENDDISDDFENYLKKKYPDVDNLRDEIASPYYADDFEKTNTAEGKIQSKPSVPFDNAFNKMKNDEMHTENVSSRQSVDPLVEQAVKDLHEIMFEYGNEIGKISNKPIFDVPNKSPKTLLKPKAITQNNRIIEENGSKSENASPEIRIPSRPRLDTGLINSRDFENVEHEFDIDERDVFDIADYASIEYSDDYIHESSTQRRKGHNRANNKVHKEDSLQEKYDAIVEDSYLKHPKPVDYYNGRKVKASGYGPVDIQKKRQEQLWKERVRNFDAKSKLKDTLAEISLRKKIEEETLALQQLREEARKRKFRENLEKSIQAKNATEDQNSGSKQPGFLAPTKAFELLQGTAKQRKHAENVLSFDEATRVEEERRAKIAAIRRKFKEKHRITLEMLMKKKRDLDKKIEEDQELEEKKKELYHRRILKMIQTVEASRNEKIAEEEYKTICELEAREEKPSLTEEPVEHNFNEDIDEAHRHSMIPRASKKKGNRRIERLTKLADEGRRESSAPATTSVSQPVVSPRRAAGSALAAIRTQRPSDTDNDDNTSTQPTISLISAVVPTFDEFVEHEDEKVHAKQKRHMNSKVYQEKMQAYLNSLSEQKRKEEFEKKKKEERIKRRAYLLSMRIMAEAAERKTMELEDNQNIPTAPNEPAPTSNTNTDSSPKSGDSKPLVIHEKKQPKPHQTAPIKEKANVQIKRNASESDEATDSKPTQKLTSDMVDTLVSRLTKPMAKAPTTITTPSGEEITVASVHYRDYNDWKRKNNVPVDTQVFCMTGWYPCVKQALLDRGWVQNSDPNSPFCDMKWTLKSIDISQEALLPWQLTNHFCKNMAITTKAGLLKSLQPLMWMADIATNDIFPRGYDMTNNEEIQAFIDDFRIQKASSLLKHVFEDVTGKATPPVKPVTSPRSSRENNGDNSPESVQYSPPKPAKDLNSYLVNKAVFQSCCAVLERMLRPLDDSFIDSPANETFDEIEGMSVTPIEWELISSHDIFSSSKLAEEPMESIDSFLQTNRQQEDAPNSTKHLTGFGYNAKKKSKYDSQRAREIASEDVKQLVPLTEHGLDRISAILSSLSRVEGGQVGLNGAGKQAHNLWIAKPAAKSRGRGITTFNDLSKLLKYVEAGSGFSSQWVVQKYMENPLIIAKRKFDLRQWVLVTDWNPLTIYFYDECYARFSVDEYDTSEIGLENAYIHLVNNSIGKTSENFNKVVSTEYGVELDGCMLTNDQFNDHIARKSGDASIPAAIKQQMKNIAKWSLMCASDMIEHRKNSWELYGFDFMIDDTYKPWLIEINSSPACDYSTKVTERYVQKALVEILNVVLDLRKWESQSKKPNRGEKPSTGGWECIYRGPLLEKPLASLGSDMTLKGTSVKIPITPHAGSTIVSPSGIPRRPFHSASNKKLLVDTNSASASGKTSVAVSTKNSVIASSEIEDELVLPILPNQLQSPKSSDLDAKKAALSTAMALLNNISSTADDITKLPQIVVKQKTHPIIFNEPKTDDSASCMDDSCDDLPEVTGNTRSESRDNKSQAMTESKAVAKQTSAINKKAALIASGSPTSSKAIPVKVFQVDF